MEGKSFEMIVKRTRRWSMLLIVALAVSIFSPAQIFRPTIVHAASSTTSSKTIDTGTTINRLEIDEQRGYIYATGSTTNELLFINKDTMEIENRLAVGSRPAGMELVNNKLYVALSGATAIAVVDLDKKLVESTINTVIQPSQVALDGNMLFYAGGDQWTDIYRKDLSDNSDTLIEKNIYQPELAIDLNRHVLYAGETGISRYLLNAYNASDGSKQWSFEPEDGGYANGLHINNGDIYYGSIRINPDDRRIISSYVGAALAIDNTYVYTQGFIYTKEEEIKVASQNFVQIAVVDSQHTMYSTSFYSSKITKDTYSFNSHERAIEYHESEGEIKFNTKLTAWTAGKDEKYLYAISTEASRLLQIDTDSFKVVGDRYIGSRPTDVDIRDGVLYVSLGGSTHIAKIDTQNESQFMAPISELEIGALTTDIAAGKGKAYYTERGGFGKIGVYDSVYSTYSGSYSTPIITLNPDASKLYIGETSGSGSKLYSMDTATGKVMQETAKGYFNMTSKEIVLDDNFVYFAGYRFDSANLSHVYGGYNQTYYAPILAAKEKIVLTYDAFYDRDTFNPIYKLPFTLSYGHIKKDNTIILFTDNTNKKAGNESFSLFKFNSFENFKTELANGIRPVEAEFLDTNEEPQKIKGILSFKPGLMKDLVSGYKLEFYDAHNNPVATTYDYLFTPFNLEPDGTYKRNLTETLPPEVRKIGIGPYISHENSENSDANSFMLMIRLWDNGTYHVDNAVLTDTDPSTNKIGGKVTFEEATGIIAGDYYTLHFADAAGEKMGQIGLPLPAGKLSNEFIIPNGTSIPAGAEMLAIQLTDEEGNEAPGYYLTEIQDRMTLAPNPDQITVSNLAGANDSVTVTGLKVGDIVKVYDLDGELYGQNTVANGSSSVVVSRLNLDNMYRILFVSVTSIGKSESFFVTKSYLSSEGTTPGGGGGTTPGGGGGSGTIIIPNPSESSTEGIAHVIVTKSANGKNLATVSIDDALLDAEIKNADSKLGEVVLKVKEKADEVQVTLTGSQLNKAIKKNENTVINIETVDTGLIVPAALFKSYNLGENDRVKVKIVEATSGIANAQLSQQGAKSVTPQYDFTISIERANGVIEEINNTAMYIKHIISFDLSDTSIETLAAITINPTNGSISPVPATFVKDGNKIKATIYRKGNSVYAVVSKQIMFKDVPSSHYANAAIKALSSRMVVQGYANGTFQPNGFVTRAEFAAMLIKALGIVPTAEETNLKDIKKSAWYYDSVSSAVKAGLLKGYEDGTFRPNQTITQQEMLVVLYGALSFGGYENKNSGNVQSFDKAQGFDEWSEQAVNVLLQEGIINKKEVFEIDADKKSTRAEGIEMLYRMLKKLKMV